MKTFIVPTLLLGITAVLTGCVGIEIGNRSSSPTPPVIVTSADAATVAEIDAAGRLDFDSSRTATLTQIASRPGLSPTAQVHLVNTAYRRVQFSDSKVAVLRAVIANPDFSDAARHAIVSQLQNLRFDSNKQAVLNELNQRLKPQHS
jgi:hypothetical protein